MGIDADDGGADGFDDQREYPSTALKSLFLDVSDPIPSGILNEKDHLRKWNDSGE